MVSFSQALGDFSGISLLNLMLQQKQHVQNDDNQLYSRAFVVDMLSIWYL